MINLILLYSTLSFILIFLSSKISYKLNFVDLPNKRKFIKLLQHTLGNYIIHNNVLFVIL